MIYSGLFFWYKIRNAVLSLYIREVRLGGGGGSCWLYVLYYLYNLVTFLRSAAHPAVSVRNIGSTFSSASICVEIE